MGNLIRFCIIQLIVLFSFSSSLFALGRGIAMGGMTSVVSDGPFDAAKNPALLTVMKDEQSFGIYGKYLAYTRTSITFDAYFLGVDPEIDTAKQDRSTMSGLLAYSLRIGKPVIGFAIVDGDEGQFYSSSTETEITATISGIGTFNTVSKEETELNSPVFHSSIGYRVSENSSVGLQLMLKYHGKNIKSKEMTSVDSVDMAFVEKDITVRTFSYSVAAGYLYRDRDTQLGFVFNMGQFSWSNQDFRYRFDDMNIAITEGTPVDNSSKGSDSYSSSGKYTKGMSFIAGGYQRLSSLFAISLEGEFTIENSFHITSLELYDDSSTDNEIYAIVESKSSVVGDNSVFVRGGLEINPFTAMSFMFGGGYILYTGRSRAINEDAYSSTRNAVYLFTCGAYYRFSERISMSVISLITQLDGELLHRAQTPTDEYSLELQQEDTSTYLFAGIVYSF
jgi:hypothetical protein